MNKVVGEKEIEILGKTYVCRPDFKALMEIESICECSLVDIFDRFAKSKPRLTDIAAILYCTHKSAEPGFVMPFAEFGDLVRRHGVNKVSFDSFMLVANVLSGGDDDKKKEETTTTPESKSEQLTQ